MIGSDEAWLDEILTDFVQGVWQASVSPLSVARRRILAHVQAERAQIEKAYGGCHKCYGKGYATVNGRWVGYDTDQDIGSPGGVVHGGKGCEMTFCTCERGRQLESLVQAERDEAARKVLH